MTTQIEGNEISLVIGGMTCGACVSHVDKALRGVPGVRAAAVNLATGMASVSGAADPAALVAAVDRAGYSAQLMGVDGHGSAAKTMREVSARGQKAERTVWMRLMVGLAAGVPAMVLDYLSMRWMAAHASHPAAHLAAFAHTSLSLEFAGVLLGTVVMAVTGWPFFTGAWRAVRHGTANMDVLVALGSGVAYLYSVVLMALQWSGRVAMGGAGANDYHSEMHAAVTIVVLVTLGKYLEARAKRRAASGVAALAGQTAATATRLAPDGALDVIPAEQITPGDRLQVLAHQSIPVDGEVVEGAGTADLSIITGESVPAEVRPGSVVPGGALLADGRIVIRATSTASASTIARILHLVNAAQAGKTKIQGLADRVAAVFVPIVLLLAAGNFAAWMFLSGNWERALLTTIATVVIACPCAMGLATPMAITVALGAAARMGILFTQATALETARGIGTVIFDKTGTLTEGSPRVDQVVPGARSELTATDVLRLAAGIEQFSEHPLARAIVAAAGAEKLALAEPVEFHSIPGGGVEGTLEDGGKLRACSWAHARESGVIVERDDGEKVGSLLAAGYSLVVLMDAGTRQLMGMIALRDPLRADAKEVLATLQRNHIRTGVLSGDSEAALRLALDGLATDFMHAEVRPEEKARAIADLRAQSSTMGGIAFVGDGINDAPALAAADLGIAMAGGAALAQSAGDVLLTSNRLAAVPEALELARRTMRIIRQNLFWAFAYNVAAIPLAMAGVLPPGVAAGAMIVSSLTVVLNALRLRKGGGNA